MEIFEIGVCFGGPGSTTQSSESDLAVVDIGEPGAAGVCGRCETGEVFVILVIARMSSGFWSSVEVVLLKAKHMSVDLVGGILWKDLDVVMCVEGDEPVKKMRLDVSKIVKLSGNGQQQAADAV